MELTAPGLTASWLICGALLGALAFVQAWRQAPWTWLWRRRAVARYVIALGAVLVVWQIRAGLSDAPAFHLLGATLSRSPSAGVWPCSASPGVEVSTALGNGDVAALGLNTCVLVVPAVSYGWARDRTAAAAPLRLPVRGRLLRCGPGQPPRLGSAAVLTWRARLRASRSARTTCRPTATGLP